MAIEDIRISPAYNPAERNPLSQQHPATFGMLKSMLEQMEKREQAGVAAHGAPDPGRRFCIENSILFCHTIRKGDEGIFYTTPSERGGHALAQASVGQMVVGKAVVLGEYNKDANRQPVAILEALNPNLSPLPEGYTVGVGITRQGLDTLDLVNEQSLRLSRDLFDPTRFLHIRELLPT
jgi:hypothetical protein